jgi:tetratricopeptide (TPR) repeat protein
VAAILADEPRRPLQHRSGLIAQYAIRTAGNLLIHIRSLSTPPLPCILFRYIPILSCSGSKRPLIRIFELNVEANPSSYTYDSLGEACMTAGDKECAMKSFRRALALSPNDMNATEGLKKLRRKNLYKFAPKFIFPAVYLQALGSPGSPVK